MENKEPRKFPMALAIIFGAVGLAGVIASATFAHKTEETRSANIESLHAISDDAAKVINAIGKIGIPQKTDDESRDEWKRRWDESQEHINNGLDQIGENIRAMKAEIARLTRENEGLRRQCGEKVGKVK